jgi:SAM-dependent methyltransferase
MASVHDWLKRRILPAWNTGARLLYGAGLYADAFRHRRFETCAVCGRWGPMLYERRVIPARLEQLWGISSRLAEALARKESCDCAWCGAKLRARRLAQAMLDTFPTGDSRSASRSVASWVRDERSQALRVAEINRIEGLHDQLRLLSHFSSSDYTPGAAPGAIVSGTASEDLTRLTYPDSSFDLVLTSESLEHVPDLNAALREIRRVLAPGGVHLFTIPVLPGVARTFARSVLLPDGTVEHRAVPIRHPGGDVGYPVFTEFGDDVPDLLRAAGFRAAVRFGPPTEDDLAQVYVAQRP